MPYKANEPRRHKIPKARYKIENWAEYDAALRQRGSLTVWVTPEAIAAWAPATTGRRGRPRDYSDVAIEAGLMLRLAFGRPWRQTEGLLGSIMDLLGLELPVPDHTTEFIPIRNMQASVIEPCRDRRHDPWLVSGSLTCSPAPRSS
jgi:hypothetical protein